MTNVGTRDGNEMRLKPVSTVLLMEFAGREGRPKEGRGVVGWGGADERMTVFQVGWVQMCEDKKTEQMTEDWKCD